MEEQTDQAIAGLGSLAISGRLVGSLTAELLTNKASMAILGTPNLAAVAGIAENEWDRFSEVFPPTAFLSSPYIWNGNEAMDLQKLIETERESLFFKLSNGEEGKGVWPGEKVDSSKLQALLEMTKKDPYSVIVQGKLKHIPFQGFVIDLPGYKIEYMIGETDAGTHYQLLGGIIGGSNSNIVMTRFAPRNGASITSNSGTDGVFRPVVTYIG